MLKLEKISNRAQRSHGNYIDARHKELEVMTADTPNHSQKISWKLSPNKCHPGCRGTLPCSLSVKIDLSSDMVCDRDGWVDLLI